MNITFEEEKDTVVRADTLKVGDGFMDDEAVYLVISRNRDSFDLTIKRTGLEPNVVVVNLTFDTLGLVRKGKMVTPIGLELVGRKDV